MINVILSNAKKNQPTDAQDITFRFTFDTTIDFLTGYPSVKEKRRNILSDFLYNNKFYVLMFQDTISDHSTSLEFMDAFDTALNNGNIGFILGI